MNPTPLQTIPFRTQQQQSESIQMNPDEGGKSEETNGSKKITTRFFNPSESFWMRKSF